MDSIEKLYEAIENNPKNVRFADLGKVCSHYFGQPRQKGSSHKIYKTPWPGNPRVNIQKSRNGMAKVYQVKQVLQAIKKIKELNE